MDLSQPTGRATRRCFIFGDFVIDVASDDVSDLAWLEDFLAPSFEVAHATNSLHAAPALHWQRNDDVVAAARSLAAKDQPRIDAFVLDSGIERLPCARAAAGDITAYDPFFDVALHRGTSFVASYAGAAAGRARGALMRVVRELTMDHLVRTGRSLLHAASFALDGRAVLLAGAKNSGKTSLLCAVLGSVPGATFLSNDRVALQGHADAPLARAMPTIVSVRPGSLELLPDLRRRLAHDNLRYTGDAHTPTDPNPRHILSPRQLCDALQAPLQAEAPVAAIVFCRIDARASSFHLEKLRHDEARPALHAALLGGFGAGGSSTLFSWPSAGSFPSLAELDARITRSAASLPCFQLTMGPALYESGNLHRFLAAVVT